MNQHTKIYAKIRKIQDLSHYGKPKYKYAIETRNLLPQEDIGSTVPEERFDSEEQAKEFIRNKGYHYTKVWYKAEQAEGLYRDGNRNIYRILGDKPASKWDELPEKDKQIYKKLTEELFGGLTNAGDMMAQMTNKETKPTPDLL